MDRSPRELVALDARQHARYTALVAAVAPAVERGLSTAVSANRVIASRVRPPVLRFAPWRVERSRFTRRLSELADGGQCLLLADVRDCYGSISPEVVESALRRMGCPRAEAAAVGRFLAELGARGVRGLPVGPDPSAVLANAVLSRLDAAVEASGARHLRWVDDVVVAVAPTGAARLLASLRAALGSVGLALNERKTRLVLDPAEVGSAGSLSAARSRVAVG